MLATRMRTVGLKKPVDCTFVTSAVNTVTQTIYTFAGQSLGAAASNRYIVAVLSSSQSEERTYDSCTIAGVSATKVVNTTGSHAFAAIFIAAVPTGATGDIVVTLSGNSQRMGLGVYRLTGLRSATPTATAWSVADVANAMSASLAIPDNGCGIGGVYAVAAAARTWTWTNLTEKYDEVVDATRTHSGAMSMTGGTLTRTATASGTVTYETLVLAAWR